MVAPMINRRSLLLGAAAAVTGCSHGLEWNGFRYFTLGDPGGVPLVVAPVGPKGIGQWLRDDWMQHFVDAGFYLLGCHWSGKDGGAEDYGARYSLIGEWMQFMKLDRPMAFAQSRGGLQLLNFACDHPQAFRKIAALYPVTDPFVFPGKGEKLWEAYDTTEAQFPHHAFTPNERATRLRGQAIKIWHGDKDELVPKRLTSDIFAAASGAQLITLPGVGHQRVLLDDIPAFLRA